MHQETISIHAGTYKEEKSKPVNSPIFTSSTAYYTHEGECQYPRYYNMPAQEVVINKIAALESCEAGFLYSSGMAAIAAVIDGLFKAGDHILFQSDLYGGTHFFLEKELPKMGIEYSFFNGDKLEELDQNLRKNTRGVYIETPSNPLLKIVDIEKIVAFARKNSLISVIDNTFASPVNQNPAKMGMDVIIHSGTKYLGGHSDLIFGAVVGSRSIINQLKEHSINFGPCINGATCGLIERSIKTLFVRVERQNENALWLAEKLSGSEFINKVYYPGLSTHDGHALAQKQMKGFGGMLSFELKTDMDGVIKFMQKLEIITPAVSLGGVESLLTSPVYTSHQKVGKQGRVKMGIEDNLLRLSVGIENKEDLFRDIEKAAKS